MKKPIFAAPRHVATRAMRAVSITSLVSLAAFASGCNKPDAPPTAAASSASPGTTSNAAIASSHVGAPTAAPNNAGSAAATAGAQVGAEAPAFTLASTDGKTVKLADYRGKIVVLEWFNPGCPFVKKSHTVGSLKTLAKKYTSEGVVWLAINSGGAGKEGAGAEASKAGAEKFGMTNPVLLDENGEVGHAYGATNTPHMFVIDQKGVLAYRGAIDNSPDAEMQSPEGGKLVNYVDVAIDAVKNGKPVPTATTKAYGCGVKYAGKS